MEAASAIFEGKFDDAVDEDGDVDMDILETGPSRPDSKRKAASVNSFRFLVSRHYCSFPLYF